MSVSESNEILKAFACKECQELSITIEDYYSCKAKHIFCGDCAENVEFVCNFENCRQTLRIVDNPLEKLVQNCNVNCKYEKNGCNWKFSIGNMASHLEECNFAPYKCVGNKLQMFSCDWEGLKKDAIEHFKDKHSNFGRCFPYFHSSFFKINHTSRATKLKGFHLINAFNKDFCFCCESNSETKEINVMIYLIGRKCTAKKFLLSFEIFTTENNYKKVTFIQQILSDADDLEDIKSNGICVSDGILKQFIVDGKLNYRLRIIKKDFKKERNNSSSSERENIQPDKSIKGNPRKMNNPFLKK